jgi:predicted peroxiredoxin
MLKENTMLAGYTPLREMMQKAIAQGVEKLAAAEGGTPDTTPEDKTTVAESVEKTASADTGIDFRNPDHMEKLASALEEAGEKIAAGFMGGESKQGGDLLDNAKPVAGKQSAKKDPAASKSPPMNPPTVAPPDSGKGGPTNSMKTNRTDPAPGGGKYPAKGVLKNASAEIVSKLQEKVEKQAAAYGSKEKDEHKRIARGSARVTGAISAAQGAVAGATSGGSPAARVAKGVAGAAVGGAAGYGLGYAGTRGANRVLRAAGGEGKSKKSSAGGAIDFILGKMDKAAAVVNGGESKQGGEQLDNTGRGIPTSGDGNADRQFLLSNKAPVSMTKKDAKKTEKKQMKEVLTEPMQSAGKDSKVQDNLRNASKGGVKIAADVSKALVEKVASEGCKCSGEGTCRFCSMKAKVEEMKAGAEK